jgi:hypothetical protein
LVTGLLVGWLIPFIEVMEEDGKLMLAAVNAIGWWSLGVW